MPDWFERLTGVREESYEDARRRLEIAGGRLRSRVNERSYAIGTLEWTASSSVIGRIASGETTIISAGRAGMIVVGR